MSEPIYGQREVGKIGGSVPHSEQKPHCVTCGYAFRPFLNGEQLQGCVWADPSQGVALVREPAMNLLDAPIYKLVYGTVEFREG